MHSQFREACSPAPSKLTRPASGGRCRNMHNSHRRQLTSRRAVGKTAVIGAKGRATKDVAAKVLTSTDTDALQGFAKDHSQKPATVYTDDAAAFDLLPFNHESVKHSLNEYVKGDVHTNGIESLCSMLECSHNGTFHRLSPKPLHRYVQEFATRHNVREVDTVDQMAELVAGMAGKRQGLPVIKVIDSRYQPSREELSEDLRLEGTFEEAIKALVRSVRSERVMPAKAMR